jgi:hypothetical protein
VQGSGTDTVPGEHDASGVVASGGLEGVEQLAHVILREPVTSLRPVHRDLDGVAVRFTNSCS